MTRPLDPSLMNDNPHNTDPYASLGAVQEEEADTLLNKKSSTPFMIGKDGMLRVLIMMAMAAFMIMSPKYNQKMVHPIYGGYRYPGEIRIYGQHHYALGGGSTPFGALGVYVQMTPHNVKTPPASEWASLAGYASEVDVTTNEGFFQALATSSVGKSLLLQFDGKQDIGALTKLLSDPLARSLGDEARVAAIVAAIVAALQDPRLIQRPESTQHQRVPEERSQLYLTCEQHRPQVHLAFGKAAESAKNPRNTAPLASTLKDQDLGASVCQALFDAFLAGEGPVAPEAKHGVAQGFTTLYGTPAKEETHDEL